MSSEDQFWVAEEDDPVLDELEVEVEADLDLIVKSRGDDTDPEPPSQWLVDPEEVQLEETDLGSLLGAVETLKGDHRDHPGAASSD
ncbi:hypothetical protein E0H73_32305 [Kribbella pittospori]|uniref:Uncharacterized protein n=1 Tax=Kribbella pittospori TaxID=722689 RepID=A0A4R0KDD3_9ACTN|nr:hypothetical protein [Kribbella pittospori]TCC56376.1 hypothetical protein E0H73_32305 [Kribbella pittospori]